MSRRVLFPAILLASLVNVIAAPPAWWASRGATNTTPLNDNAAVNQGQLKQFTQKAVQELNARAPGGAGTELNGLVNGWIQAYSPEGYSASNPLPADFEAMNSGQLKWIASKIHACLVAIRYKDAPPPWLVRNPTTDNQLVNLGQLKTVFNFDLTAPTGQLPQWWQRFYFDQIGLTSDTMSERSVLTYLQCYQQGLSPLLPPPAPVLAVTELNYSTSQTVILTPSMQASIAYTLNGESPTTSPSRMSLLSQTTLSFSESATLKAVSSTPQRGASIVTVLDVVVTSNELQFNSLNRRPRYLLRPAQ